MNITGKAMKALHDKLQKKSEEVDRLTAEVEHLRWHYPERGELPDYQRLIAWKVVEYYYIGYFHPGAGFIEDKKNFHPEQVTRWRYIE